jgi:hypothetical protein
MKAISWKYRMVSGREDFVLLVVLAVNLKMRIT